MTSQAIRSATSAEARIEPGQVDLASRRPRSRAPRARRMPAPPSVVALPPIPSDDLAHARVERRDQHLARAARRRPERVALRGGEPRQPGRLGQLDDGPLAVGRREPARLDRPPDRVVRRRSPPVPAAGRLDRRRACPRRRRRAARAAARRRGRARAQPSASAPRDLDRGQRALERVGREQDRAAAASPLDGAQRPTGSSDRHRRASRRARPVRRRSRYSGMRTIGGRSWSASSMTSSDSRPSPGARQLHRRAELGEQARLAPLLEPLHHRLEDDEAHPRQALELLVAVDPPLEVDLAEALEPDPLGDVDEVARSRPRSR